MPSIDALAPATSASDSDELLISQAGVARKITRAQLLNGVQPAFALPAGSLLGNTGTAVGSPTAVTLGPTRLDIVGNRPFLCNRHTCTR